MSRSRYFQNTFPDYSPGVVFERPKEEWHSQILSIIQQVIHASENQSSDGGLYVGTAGMAYMLYFASEYEPLNQHKDKLLKTALDIIKKDLQYAEETKSGPEKVSFILGPAGIYAIAAMIGKAVNNKAMVEENVQKYQSILKHSMKKDFLRCGCNELFVGRAGYLCGVLALEKNLAEKGDSELSQTWIAQSVEEVTSISGKAFTILSKTEVNSICQAIVDSGRQYSQSHKSSAPLMYAYYDTEYVGAAHGISSILQMILCCPSFCASGVAGVNLVKSTVDWLLAIQQPNGNFVPSLDELGKQRPENKELFHWCHGAAGVVYLFARAYQVWKKPEYLDACLKCGEATWQKGLLRKGSGICHGVAGNGYVFLLLYRLTKDKKHLYRAHKFAEFMFSEEFGRNARVPDNPFSLYEGWAGSVCFLIDLLQPEKAEYPFFSVI